MRWCFTILFFAALVAVPAAGQAQHLQLSADASRVRFLDDAQSGFGFDAYPGIRAGIVTLEAQIGWHRGSDRPTPDISRGPGVTYVPVMLGGRASLPLGLVSPWVGAHGGFSYLSRATGSPYGNVTYVDREWEPAFNAGAGLDVRLGRWSVGGAVWYHATLDPDDQMRALTAGIGLSIAL